MNRLGFLCIAFLFLFPGLLGCNNDSRYFCIADGPISDRGCFICRGDDCEEQPPPTRPVCMDDVDCAVSELCTDLGCVRECTEAFDCAIGTTCLDGLCLNPTEPLTNCSDDTQCADYEYCSGFQCIPDTRPETFCPENECQPGRVCRRGQCRTPCETDDECARIDATIRFCAPVEGENLCVRSIEVLAECQLNIDCGLGDECVDGSCASASP